MRVLLVYPEYPTTFWSFSYAIKFISKKASLPPLGLITVSSLLPPAWEQRLVDMNIEPLSDEHLLWADYVLLSAMSIQRESVDHVIARCKTLGVKMIAGGPLFTSTPQEFGMIDHLVLNEAEITVPLFLRDLEEGKAARIYTSSQWAGLQAGPTPNFDLLNREAYASMSIQYSRGCPFDCEFCNITVLYGRIPRTKSKSRILAELEALHERGWRKGVFIVDDNFIGNKGKLKKEILPALIEWMQERNYPFTLYTEVSINLSDDEELMRLMALAGFDQVFIGIETPNDESLAECSKVQNRNRDLIASVRKIQKAGLEVQAGFILGFDKDPATIFDRLTSFIQESGIATAMVGLLNAPHGTKLYRRLKEEGRLIKSATGDNTDFSINFIPKMNKQHLIDGYRTLLQTIYSPKHYYARVMTFLKEYRPVNLRKNRLNLEQFKALIKSFVKLGIIGKERYHYWKLLFWSLLRKPRLISLAITLSIYGFHFRKIFARYEKEYRKKRLKS